MLAGLVTMQHPRNGNADAFGGRLGLPVSDVGVAQHHARALVAEHADDDRQRDTLQNCVAGEPVSQVWPIDSSWGGPLGYGPVLLRKPFRSERDAVFSGANLLAAALSHSPGAASVETVERAADGLKREGRLHDAPAFEGGNGLTTDRAVAGERETVALMRAGAARGGGADARLDGRPASAQGAAHGRAEAGGEADPEREGPHGRRAGYVGTGKTRMLGRARTLAERKGWRKRQAPLVRYASRSALARRALRAMCPAASHFALATGALPRTFRPVNTRFATHPRIVAASCATQCRVLSPSHASLRLGLDRLHGCNRTRLYGGAASISHLTRRAGAAARMLFGVLI